MKQKTPQLVFAHPLYLPRDGRLKRGDELLMVNSTGLLGMSLGDASKALRKLPYGPIRVVYSCSKPDGGETNNVVIPEIRTTPDGGTYLTYLTSFLYVSRSSITESISFTSLRAVSCRYWRSSVY